MKKVIYSNIVVQKLEALKYRLIAVQGKVKGEKTIKSIMSNLDNLAIFSLDGTSIREKYGIDCDYRYIYAHKNYFIFKTTQTQVNIIEMFNEKEDFIFKLFGVPMRSKDSMDYWGE